MEDDPLSPIAPARVHCLVVPCGSIRQSRFQQFIGRLRHAGIVRLGDISPDARPQRSKIFPVSNYDKSSASSSHVLTGLAMFSPLAFPTGLMLYDLSTSTPSPSRLALTPLELYREPLAIIGIADGKDYKLGKGDGPISTYNDDLSRTPIKESIDQLLEAVLALKDQHPTALVHQVFIFDFDETNLLLPPSLIPVPSPQKSRTTTMKTIMCDLSSLILAEMTGYAKSLQALPNVETPRQLQSDRTINDYFTSHDLHQDSGSKPSSGAEKFLHRMSTPMQRSVSGTSGSSNPGSRVMSPANGVITPTMASEISNNAWERSSSPVDQEMPRPASRDKFPLAGSGTSGAGERVKSKARGRICVVIGSMYLFAGRWPDAVRELIEGATLARASSDHVWHAKALDYLLVCTLIYGWAGMDFEIPQILYPTGDKPSKSAKHTPSSSVSDLPSMRSPNAANRLVSLQNLTNLLPDLVNNILNLYGRAATFTSDQLPQVAFSECTIRFAKLLAIIDDSHGILNDRALQSVVLNMNNTPKDVSIPTKLTPFSTKSEITAILFRAFPASTVESALSIDDRVAILAGIASVLSKIGYQRKKAFVLRELLNTILPALVQSRKDGAAELGFHPAASLSSLNLVDNTAGPQKSPKYGVFEYGMQDFLAVICQIYGIVLSVPAGSTIDKDDSNLTQQDDSKDPGLENLDSLQVIVVRAVYQAMVRTFGSQTLKLDILRSCINICEALPDLGGILRFSSDLLRTASSGIAPGPDSTDGSPLLSVDDQVHLANSISRTVSTAKLHGLDKLDAEYWDEFLVREVGVINAVTPRAVVMRAKAELEITGKLGAEEKQGPFIYNPSITKPKSAAVEPLLVVGEAAEFRITLQNLYDFDVDIESAKLQTTGVTIESAKQGTVVGPYRTQTMQLFGTPMTSGLVDIIGCIVKIKGCRERNFPIFNAPWSNKPGPKVKGIGLSAMAAAKDARPESVSSDPVKSQSRQRVNVPIALNTTLEVIEPQPDVIVKSTTLSQSALMLLEGETQTFSITLHNASQSVPADLLLLSFTDSTSHSLQSSSGSKELTPAELHELEFSSSQRQAFRWRRTNLKEDPSIAPKCDLTLEIEIFGKPGLSYGSIQIDYGFLGSPRLEVTEKFYTRQTVIPVTVTVNASADLIRNDLLPFSSNFAWSNQKRQQLPNGNAERTPPDQRRRAGSRVTAKNENRFQSLLARLGTGPYGENHCLLLLDLHNAWPNPLSITVQVRETLNKDQSPGDSWKRAYSVHEVLQPGHTSRLVLLLPRIYLIDPYAPIVSLNPARKRQYVVGTSKVPPETERNNREIFWYREEVLKHIRGSWEEDATGRTGQIELRSLRLSTRMVDALKLEDVGIHMALTAAEKDLGSVSQVERSKFQATTNSFCTLTALITNRSRQPVHSLLRMQPSLRNQPYNVALDLAKKFAWNGLLQRSLPLLPPGECIEVQLGCCFLCSGEFEINASVEEIRVWKPPADDSIEGGRGTRARATTTDLMDGDVLKQEERRIWHAREPCVVYARDDEDTER